MNWFLDSDFIPVISPIGFDNNFKTYNINADTMAGKVSSSIKSERLILLTDVKGVVDKKGTINQISIKDVKKLIKNNTIKDGMIPKLKRKKRCSSKWRKSCSNFRRNTSHAILLEIFTEYESWNTGYKIMSLEVFKLKNCWLFDLDNTFYSPVQKIFDKIDLRMKKFIAEKLKISYEKAFEVQKLLS